MLTVAYLANQFPSAVEPYVSEEIEELRRRGVRVLAGSGLRPEKNAPIPTSDCAPEIVLWPPQGVILLRGLSLCVRRWSRISCLVQRIVFRGPESGWQRFKALLHTWMGACYAARLEGRGVQHIHVHHGYFGAWIAMVAGQLLGVKFSMTLHGSDLLLYRAYLDVKLQGCASCFTISEYNRNYILEHYPKIDPKKVVVARLGVEVPEERAASPSSPGKTEEPFRLLAAGRLHAVKDHAFLIRGCAHLQAHGLSVQCVIAGDGPERRKLEALIRQYGLRSSVSLLGHVPREEMGAWYEDAEVVVLTSRSEGIPLVVMEAMSRGKIVLAPAITGIPELVVHGQSGFLYEPGSMHDFVTQLSHIHWMVQAQKRADEPDCPPPISAAARQLQHMRQTAWLQVYEKFNRRRNLETFADLFLARISGQNESLADENPVLQQIQLSLQRDRSLPV